MGKFSRPKPMTRYVYLMRVRLPFYDLRWIGHKVQGRQLWKIGVAKDPTARAKQVDDSTPAGVRLRHKFYCQTATRHEKHLHKAYENHRFLMLADGGTEVFLLTPKQVREARRYLRRASNAQSPFDYLVGIAAFIVFVLCLFTYLFTFAPSAV